MTKPEAWKDRYAKELFTYERLMARSIQSNAMQWQVPALALTAQAFLLSIGLTRNRAPGLATTACVVGMLVIAMAWHLMGRHRYYFHLDQEAMLRLETEIGLSHISSRDVMSSVSPVRAPMSARVSGFLVWRLGLPLVGCIDVGIAVTAWWQPSSVFSWRMTGALIAGIAFALLIWSFHRLLYQEQGVLTRRPF